MSWEQLRDIYRVAAAEKRANDALRPIACPNDGEPLESGSNGSLHCRSDGWSWPSDKS